MLRNTTMLGVAIAAMTVLATPAPALAQVREGVEAWSRGDYAAAVAEWQAPAEAGDADALFNLAQAYRLGRGVPQDEARAEALYAQAAQAGHVQAADTYGLMLFQDGRREEALPYVEGAASRGDPRAQYLLGIAHFNGDIVGRDWTRAYALLTLANAAGLPQASAAITQMDQHIPIEQRQAAAGLARQMEADAERARAVELAAADLGAQAPAPQARPAASPRVPRPIPTVDVSPSIAAARDAVRQAREATGTESPADAGATFARGEPRSAPPPVRVAEARPPATATPAPAPAAAPPPRDRTSGPWRVQLGAFGVAGNAERLWNRLASRPEIAGRERLLIPTGRVTRLQAGGYATRDEAQTACNSLRSAGVDCLVRSD
ncbi:SPOR domain-containing protein [Aurantiacibacter sp. MUD61]|uniref:SPOR domain-containing protein n=1 Tax=Aurantiacibacter sp. MUD61 TaxID=3009083 RepID=UPI0022F06F53|nr:SPOR domain-containing protein [Aurantiacibacter sp. MUD61]